MRIALLLSALLIAIAVGPAQAQSYGTGAVVDVPRVEPGAIEVDGVMDEAAWENALVLDATENWDGDWSGHPDADVGVESRLLYSEGVLYIFTTVSDYDVRFDPDGGDQLIVGLDPVHEAGVSDRETDENFSGFPHNAPDQGPFAYRIWPGNDTIPAFSINFSTDFTPEESGWVDGEFFFDEQTLEWGFEAAFMLDAVSEGNEIGFNIGGAQSKEEGLEDRGINDYAWFSWQVCDPDAHEDELWCGAGGTIISDARSMGTLVFGATTGIEQEKLDELPAQFALAQNYPNPFNPSTTIEFSITRAGSVSLDVFNLLGQHVTSLVDEPTAAGTYRLSWEAGNLPSGMYVYQLRLDGELLQSRKMMLVK